jgi:hypothetical protein
METVMTTAKKMTWILAVCSLSFATFTFAQPKGPAACDQCPMRATSELSEVKVEMTKDGATIRLRAKRAEDVTKVQEAAQQVAAALSGGDCMMHASHHCDHGHKHGHGHGHGHGHNPQAPDTK